MAVILLVEDVLIVRSTLAKFLERGGHSVSLCSSGDEAWSRFGEERFDCIVTDIWMKDGDGVELIRRLRTEGHQTPVVALTGGDPRSPQSTSADIASQAGANRVLMKPVTKAVLLDTILELIPVPLHGSERRQLDIGGDSGSQ